MRGSPRPVRGNRASSDTVISAKALPTARSPARGLSKAPAWYRDIPRGGRQPSAANTVSLTYCAEGVTQRSASVRNLDTANQNVTLLVPPQGGIPGNFAGESPMPSCGGREPSAPGSSPGYAYFVICLEQLPLTSTLIDPVREFRCSPRPGRWPSPLRVGDAAGGQRPGPPDPESPAGAWRQSGPVELTGLQALLRYLRRVSRPGNACMGLACEGRRTRRGQPCVALNVSGCPHGGHRSRECLPRAGCSTTSRTRAAVTSVASSAMRSEPRPAAASTTCGPARARR